jgi:hypothetical protein
MSFILVNRSWSLLWFFLVNYLIGGCFKNLCIMRTRALCTTLISVELQSTNIAIQQMQALFRSQTTNDRYYIYHGITTKKGFTELLLLLIYTGWLKQRLHKTPHDIPSFTSCGSYGSDSTRCIRAYLGGSIGLARLAAW